ncbi:MAG: hypothetical protein HRT71_06280 [Flavobacteriales bacterium]|nr:hypothetical protein [Flavobacteriales bacterium]
MDLQTTKIELAKLILDLENPSIVKKIVNLLKAEQTDFWDDLSKAEKEEIGLGIRQLNAGQSISLEDFLKKAS